jgi:uncharacterized YccA/Bax inhibitor family protein
MASEMRRIAKALVDKRRETFASRYPREESATRLDRALHGFAPERVRYETALRQEHDGMHLDLTLSPSPRVDVLLKATAIVMMLLLASTVWAYLAADVEPAMKFLVTLAAALGILAFPFVTVALGSQREAEEATMRRAIRKALVEEELE